MQNAGVEMIEMYKKQNKKKGKIRFLDSGHRGEARDDFFSDRAIIFRKYSTTILLLAS